MSSEQFKRDCPAFSSEWICPIGILGSIQQVSLSSVHRRYFIVHNGSWKLILSPYQFAPSPKSKSHAIGSWCNNITIWAIWQKSVIRFGMSRPMARHGRQLPSFSAVAWKCGARDHWIGWSYRHQYSRLNFIAHNNSVKSPRYDRYPWLYSARSRMRKTETH